MPDYVTASATKDHFQNQLLQDHPEIVSIAPRLKLGDDGHPTTEAVIVVGVRARYPLRPGPGASAHPPAGLIPNELPAFDAQGAQLLGQTVLVLVEDEGEILPEMHTAARRPCPGGFSIGHYRIAAGTLGGVVSLGAAWGYILSNNHVLAATNSGAAGDPICQPGVVDGGTTATAIGTLHSWVPIDFSGRPNEADCALVQAQPPWANQVSRNVFGIGAPAGVAVATVGQAVRKSGRTTQITSGTILSDNATIRL